MLPRAHRLPRLLCDLVFRRGRRVRGDFADLVWLPSRRDEVRISVAVPKKWDKRAVRRNRVARRFQEAIRGELGAFPPTLGMLVWHASNPVDVEPDFERLRAEIRRLASSVSAGDSRR